MKFQPVWRVECGISCLLFTILKTFGNQQLTILRPFGGFLPHKMAFFGFFPPPKCRSFTMPRRDLGTQQLEMLIMKLTTTRFANKKQKFLKVNSFLSSFRLFKPDIIIYFCFSFLFIQRVAKKSWILEKPGF